VNAFLTRPLEGVWPYLWLDATYVKVREGLRSLADRGLRSAKLVIADDHEGLRAAARRVFNATHQRWSNGRQRSRSIG